MSAVREAFARGVSRLAAAGIESARLDARVLLAHALGCETGDLLARDAATPGEIERFDAFVARRVAREPVSYITGCKEFFGLPFEVGRGVLVPRPDSETLIEEVLRAFPDRDAPLRMLDLGTGSGCLLAACLSRFPNASGVGVDLSADALAMAERNLARLGLSRRARLVEGDWNAQTGERFEVVLSNPPYLSHEEWAETEADLRLYEPPGALVAGPEGLDAYRALAPLLAVRLASAGLAFFEIGAGRSEAVAAILSRSSLEVRRVASDLTGIPRCLVVGRAGSAAAPP